MANLQSFESNPEFADEGSCDLISYDQPVFVGLQIGIKFNDKREDGKYGLNLQLKYNQRALVDGQNKIVQLIQECYFLVMIDKPISIDTIKYDHAMLFLPIVREAIDKMEKHALNNDCKKIGINTFSDTYIISAILKSEPHYTDVV